MVHGRLIVLLIFAVTIRVQSQLDSNGFLSIDCGLPTNSSYVDNATNIKYVSDEKFIDTGNNSEISTNYSREYNTVRYFPSGTRNCYTMRSLTVGFKYLIRAGFYYGNYDNKNKPPIFDIYFGINFWNTMDPSSSLHYEIIVNATTDYLEFCLVNTGNGDPYISWLHLRQVNSPYLTVNSTQSLHLIKRLNIGGGNQQLVMYPDDKNDLWWSSYSDTGWKEISTNSTIQPDPDLQTPSVVLQTGATTSSTQQPLNIIWNSDDKSTKYYFILRFYEIRTSLTGRREFNVLVNGFKAFPESIILEPQHPWDFSTHRRSGYTNYTVSLVATSISTLPPLINAFELHNVRPVGVPTYSADDTSLVRWKGFNSSDSSFEADSMGFRLEFTKGLGELKNTLVLLEYLIFKGDSVLLHAVSAINSVKKYHNIKKGWSGDPCLPSQFLWTGITCTTDSSNIARITGLNLSSNQLTGPLSDSIGNLTALEYLHLSNNDLSGYLPTTLDKLTALKFLDIRGNPNISIVLPPVLDQKQKNRSLEYRFDDINPIPSPRSAKKIVNLIEIGVGVLLVIAVIAAAVIWLKRTAKIKILNFENRKFSYKDLKKITNGFKYTIGRGGFGAVYLGQLENGLQVAVKVRSESSSQGIKEFKVEAENLARVHHKNLLSLTGYCIDKNRMALVYEYMQNGNLHDKLNDNETPLSWRQRLLIAYESALGLEYLHTACNPPLIHRDVKTSNILLNANLEAKMADFGLCKAIHGDAITHISTGVVGTLGFLDPEYFSTEQLRVKSDVFSFGVVLLEIIMGQHPTSMGFQGGNLAQWMRDKISTGDIERIVDPRMEGNYRINSVLKFMDLACQCTESTYSERPSMSDVAAVLQESLDLEESAENLVTNVNLEETHVQSVENLVTNANLEETHLLSAHNLVTNVNQEFVTASESELQ